MADAAIWLVLAVLFAVGVMLTRFNPLVVYSRKLLFGLAVGAVLAVGVVLGLSFFGLPPVTPSGVTDPNGG